MTYSDRYTFIVMLGSIALTWLGVMTYMAFTSWREDKRDACEHQVQSDMRWTQDGWVTVCLVCREWLYHGDER